MVQIMSIGVSVRPVLRMAWRHALGRPLQSAFLVVGVMIGVAMIVGIDLANSSAERAFALGVEAVTGRANYQVVGGPTGLDTEVYTAVRSELGYRLSAPVVEDYVVVQELDSQPMRLLAVDPFAEAPFRRYLGDDAGSGLASTSVIDLITRPNTTLLSSGLAERYGVAPGDTLTVRFGSKQHVLQVIGLLQPQDDLSRRALDTLLLVDISTGQEILDRIGRIDKIDLLVEDGETGRSDLARIAELLPENARLIPTDARTGAVQEMTRAFRLNLTALSLLALVVGMFLIYNTVTFSVVQRRSVLGSLRALGMTRREVYALILVEATALGVIGTAAGLLLGILLGRGMVGLVTQTMNDLFFVVSVREMPIAFSTIAKGAVVGIFAAVLGAAVPAYEATSVSPAGAMMRSGAEERTRRILPLVSGVAMAMIVSGALLLIPEGSLLASLVGLFFIIVGSALLTPLLTLGVMAAVQRLTHRTAGVIGRMAPRYVVRSLSRTSVAIAALMVAVSVIIGVGIMIGSFRTTVELWLNDVLQADIFVSPPSISANQVTTPLPPDIVAELAAFDGVASTMTTRGVDVAMFLDGRDGMSDHDSSLEVRLVALSGDLAGEDRKYRASVGDWRETWRALENGGVILSEPLARSQELTVGDKVTLLTGRGLAEFPVVGVAVSYDVRPVIFIHTPVFSTWWDDESVSAMALFVEDGVDVDEKVEEIRNVFAGRAELVVQSNQGSRQDALDVFDRTFAITIALQLLAMLVAFIGILSTLMSLQLERTREIGVLRSTGMTRRQLWRLSLYETGLIGGAAGLFAIPTGLVLAVVLIYIINLRSFGWSLEMRLTPGDFLQATAVAVGAALLAGLYPAWRLGRMQPADAVRTE
jgi:putative ABC transport system permease protein